MPSLMDACNIGGGPAGEGDRSSIGYGSLSHRSHFPDGPRGRVNARHGVRQSCVELEPRPCQNYRHLFLGGLMSRQVVVRFSGGRIPGVG
jgi:hypothetical protein